MNKTYQIVEGTRVNPGKVLRTFASDKTYKCGGPATACLRAFDRMKTANEGMQIFFRSVMA